MEVWVTFGTTESGDDWTLVFSRRPNDRDIKAAFEANPWLKEEYDAECIQGWTTVKETVIDNGNKTD